jgi:tetratricopeptide (TPR) repeat protein
LEFPDSVLDDLLKLTPDQRYQYPQVHPNPNLDPETEQQRLFENMVTFCHLLSDEFPLLMVVEDVHWGDSGTMKMLHHLIRRTQKQPVMFLVTYREIELKKSRPFNEMLLELNRQRLGRRMKLDRLDQDQTREMLAEIFAEHITPEFLDGIYHETDGNPFFIEEVCRALVESGVIYFADGQWHRPEDMAELEIPQGVQIAVETRLAQLPQEHQEILSMASILGREFEFETLLKALDVDEDTLIEALEAAEEAQMIQEVDGKGEITFSFVHALVPSAITESVRTLRRRKLHRKAAQAIEVLSPKDYEALAYHFGEAGNEEMALKYYILAGERASAAFANQDAEEHFLAALDLVETDNDKANLLVHLGLSHVGQNKYGLAIETWNRAIALYQEMGDLDKVAEIYARSARATWDDGDTTAELAICRQGISLMEGMPDGPGMARLLAETSRACLFNGLHNESELHGQQALQMSKKLDIPSIQAEALTTLGMLSGNSGEEAVAILNQAIDLTKSADLPRQALRAHNNIAVQYFLKLGDLPRAIDHIQKAVEIANLIGDQEFELFSYVNLYSWMILQGQLRTVKEMMPSLEELLESLPDPGAGGIGLNQLKSTLLTYQGKLDQALELLQERYAEVHKVGDLQRLRNVLFSLALISLIRKDYERGKIVCEEMIQIAKTGMIPISLSHSLLSMIYSREGEVQKARQLLEESLKEADDPGSEFFDLAYLLWAQADLNVAEENWDEAWSHYDAFSNLATQHNLRWYRNWIKVEWAEAMLARDESGDREQALEMLGEARRQFEDMGADGYVSMIEDRLSALERS